MTIFSQRYAFTGNLQKGSVARFKGTLNHMSYCFGKSFAYEGLYVIDGSVFPTSIGANPQLSIYGLASRNASALAERLAGTQIEWPRSA